MAKAKLKPPANQVVESKYTAGKEFRETISLREYQGYYYEYNNSYFAGKTFDVNAIELIPIRRSQSPFLSTLSSFVYNTIAGGVANTVTNAIKPQSYNYQYDSNTRYYSYSIKDQIIKEINKETFEAIQPNTLYATVSLSYNGGFNNIELDEAEKKIPGIRTFVENSYIRPKTEDGGGLVG
jgi:hypothetical protein